MFFPSKIEAVQPATYNFENGTKPETTVTTTTIDVPYEFALYNQGHGKNHNLWTFSYRYRAAVRMVSVVMSEGLPQDYIAYRMLVAAKVDVSQVVSIFKNDLYKIITEHFNSCMRVFLVNYFGRTEAWLDEAIKVNEDGFIKSTVPNAAHTLPEDIKQSMPAMSARVGFPCDCGDGWGTLFYVIQHLNDVHKQTREEIADWLDELHESGKVNIEFEPWEESTESELK